MILIFNLASSHSPDKTPQRQATPLRTRMASDGLQMHGEAYSRPMPKTIRVTRGQIMAFRLQRLNIARRARALGAAVGDLGLPDYPPGAALDALGARLLQPTPDTLDTAYEERVLVRMRAMRGAPLVVRPADYDTFIAGVLPQDEAAMRAFIGPAITSVRAAKSTALEAVSLVSQVTRRALARGPLDRDQLHAELRDNLPEGMFKAARTPRRAQSSNTKPLSSFRSEVSVTCRSNGPRPRRAASSRHLKRGL